MNWFPDTTLPCSAPSAARRLRANGRVKCFLRPENPQKNVPVTAPPVPAVNEIEILRPESSSLSGRNIFIGNAKSPGKGLLVHPAGILRRRAARAPHRRNAAISRRSFLRRANGGFSPLPNAKSPGKGLLVHPAGILRRRAARAPHRRNAAISRRSFLRRANGGFSPLPNAKSPGKGLLVHPAGIEPTTFSVGG